MAVNSYGVIQHFQKLKAADIITQGMDASEYIHFTEARAQASLTHNKIRSKRFRELVAPLLAANEIPCTDDLIESLGFLANDIVVDLLERAKGEARRRIMALRKAEQVVKDREEASKEAQRRAQASVAEERARRKARLAKRRGDASGPADGALAADATMEVSDSGPAAGEDNVERTTMAEAERVARREIDSGNARPTGPFSAPAASLQQAYPHSTSGFPAINKISSALACPATVESPMDIPYDSDNAASARADDGGPALLPGASRGQEATKVESQTAMSDTVSGFDILLGDFESAVHAWGDGVGSTCGCRSMKRKRGFAGACA